MKKIILILLVLFGFAFSWERRWDFGNNERFTGIVQLSDGGFMLVGSTGSSLPICVDLLIMRTDKFGDTIWTRTFGGDDNDAGKDIVALNDSVFIVLGNNSSFYPEDWRNLYLIKIKDNGDTIGQMFIMKRLTGILSNLDEDYNIGVGGVWTISKFDTAGTWFWSYHVNLTPYGLYGLINDMKCIPGNQYITTGHGTLTEERDLDAILCKHDSLGDTLWLRHYDEHDSRDASGSVLYIKNPAGDYPPGFILAGSTNDAETHTMQYYVVRTDTSGEVVWSRTYCHPDYEINGKQLVQDMVWAEDVEAQSTIILAGVTSYPVHLGGYNALWLVAISDTLDGEILWTNSYDVRGNINVNRILRCSDGGYTIVGSLEPATNVFDLWLLRVDSLGNSVPDGISEPPNTQAVPADLALRCWPNPFNSAVTIQLSEQSAFRILDVCGKCVYHHQKPTAEFVWNPHDLRAGIYLVQAIPNGAMNRMLYVK